MRITPFIPPIIITSMMVAAFFITVVFENQVPLAVQQSMAQQAPFLNVRTSGNLVVSLGNFLLATILADLVIFLPLLILGRRGGRVSRA